MVERTLLPGSVTDSRMIVDFRKLFKYGETEVEVPNDFRKVTQRDHDRSRIRV